MNNSNREPLDETRQEYFSFLRRSSPFGSRTIVNVTPPNPPAPLIAREPILSSTPSNNPLRSLVLQTSEALVSSASALGIIRSTTRASSSAAAPHSASDDEPFESRLEYVSASPSVADAPTINMSAPRPCVEYAGSTAIYKSNVRAHTIRVRATGERVATAEGLHSIAAQTYYPRTQPFDYLFAIVNEDTPSEAMWEYLAVSNEWKKIVEGERRNITVEGVRWSYSLSKKGRSSGLPAFSKTRYGCLA